MDFSLRVDLRERAHAQGACVAAGFVDFAIVGGPIDEVYLHIV
jgi:hypothetical protein